MEGYIGLNEAILIKTPPPAEVVEYLSSSFFGAKIETSVAWEKLLAESGLKDLVVRTYGLTVLSDAINRIRWFGFRDILLTWSRLLSMYLSGSASRREIKKMLLLIRMPQRTSMSSEGTEYTLGGSDSSFSGVAGMTVNELPEAAQASWIML